MDETPKNANEPSAARGDRVEPPVPTFEESLARLEEIAHDLEEGDLGLDAALARYQEGVARLRECRKLLQLAERKIELLTGVTDSGEAITAPFDDGPTDATAIASADGANSRAKRRSAPKAKRASPGGDSTAMDSKGPAESSPVESSPVESKRQASKVDVDSPKRLF